MATVRAATRSDVPATARVLARAFDDDPVMTWMWPDVADRRRGLPRMFAAFTPDRWRTSGYGVKFVFTFGVGSTAVWLVAWVDGTLGLSRVFGALAIVVALLVAAAGVLIATTDPMSPGRRASRAPV